jgi:hypothetical protein
MCVIPFSQLIRSNLLSFLYDTGERWLHLPLKVSIFAFSADKRAYIDDLQPRDFQLPFLG